MSTNNTCMTPTNSLAESDQILRRSVPSKEQTTVKQNNAEATSDFLDAQQQQEFEALNRFEAQQKQGRTLRSQMKLIEYADKLCLQIPGPDMTPWLLIPTLGQPKKQQQAYPEALDEKERQLFGEIQDLLGNLYSNTKSRFATDLFAPIFANDIAIPLKELHPELAANESVLRYVGLAPYAPQEGIVGSRLLALQLTGFDALTALPPKTYQEALEKLLTLFKDFHAQKLHADITPVAQELASQEDIPSTLQASLVHTEGTIQIRLCSREFGVLHAAVYESKSRKSLGIDINTERKIPIEFLVQPGLKEAQILAMVQENLSFISSCLRSVKLPDLPPFSGAEPSKFKA